MPARERSASQRRDPEVQSAVVGALLPVHSPPPAVAEGGLDVAAVQKRQQVDQPHDAAPTMQEKQAAVACAAAASLVPASVPAAAALA